MQKNRLNSDSGKHALVPPPHSSTPASPARIPAPPFSNLGMHKILRNRNQGEDPLGSSPDSKALPIPREPSKVSKSPCDMIIDITPCDSEPETRSERASWGVFRTSAIEQVVHNIYPEFSETPLRVEKGKVLLGSRKVGSLIKKREGPDCIRIWVDQVLTNELKEAYCTREEPSKAEKRLSRMLPLSAICGMVFVNAYTLAQILESSSYAAIISDGCAVRLEFHEKKRAEPTKSFILKTHM